MREAKEEWARPSQKAYVEANRKKVAALQAAWYQKNKDRVRLQKQVYYPRALARLNERRKTDPTFAVTKRLRMRMAKMLSACGAKREASCLALIGCTPEEFLRHIEAQFVPGMSWENRGQWHLDHKLPCSYFDLTDPAQQLLCFNYTNVRPLWVAENLRKGAKLLPEFLPA